jgi:hypothetical protein
MATVSPQFIIEGLKRRGYPEHVAQGFVMNMMDESGLNPGINEAAPIVPGSRGGFGLYQLTGPRRTAYEQFAAQRGVNPADAEAQLDFLDYELKGPESRAAKSILSTQNPQQAAVAIARDFLRPATEHLNRRVARYSGADVAADTMAALGKGGGTVTPDQIAQGAMAQSAGQEPEQPRGLLGNLFGNPDTMAALAMAFNSMRLNPDPNLSAVLSAQMKERRGERKDKAQRNSTAEWLRSMKMEDLARAVETGALTGAQAISLARSGGSKDGTAAMQNYAEYNRILKEQGPEAADKFWQMSGGKGLQPQFGTIPAGFELVQDRATGGYRMQPIKGGPADIEAQQNVAAQQERVAGQQKYGQVVLENVDRIREKIKSSSLPVAGIIGSVLSKVPGTDAYDVGAMADTIRANIGFERLNEMRKESPTGGALGQVTERELAFLQNSLANLEQSQSQEQFERSLDVVENAYKSIMNKFSAYPNAAKYGFSGQQPSSGAAATHRFNPQTGKVEEIK